MARRNFYLAASGTGADGGVATTETQPGTSGNLTSGWTVAKTAAARYSNLQTGTKRAATTFTTTLVPTALDNTLKNWIEIDPGGAGTFANDAGWGVSLRFRSTLQSSQAGRARYRMFKGTSPTTATELTSGVVQGTIITTSTTVYNVSSASISPGAISVAAGEKIYLALAWEITTAGGSNSADVVLAFTKSTDPISYIETADWTPDAGGTNYPLSLSGSVGSSAGITKSVVRQVVAAISSAGSVAKLKFVLKLLSGQVGGGGGDANDLLWSEDFTNAVWSNPSGATITANNVTAPDATNTADTVTLFDYVRIFQTVTYGSAVSGRSFNFSIWLKSSSTTPILMKLYDNFGALVVSTLKGLSSTWTRYDVSGVVGGGAGTQVICEFYNNPDVGSGGARSLDVWGAMLRPDATTPGNYSKTTTTAVSGGGGGTSLAGILTTLKQKFVSVTGSVSSVGSLAKKLFRSLVASVSSTGTLTKKLFRLLIASVASSGVIIRVKAATKLLTGTIILVGTIAKAIVRTLVGSVASAGVLLRVKSVAKLLAGTVTSSGIVARVKSVNKVVAGTVVSVGTIVKTIARFLVATVASSGLLTASKAAFKTLTATVSSFGSTLKSLARFLVASVASSGVVSRIRLITQTFSGSVASVGTISKSIARILIAGVISTGQTTKTLGRSLVASVANAGSIAKNVGKVLVASVGNLGTLASPKTLLPVSTIQTGGWTTNAASFEDALSDEDDATYITSPVSPVNATAIVGIEGTPLPGEGIVTISFNAVKL